MCKKIEQAKRVFLSVILFSYRQSSKKHKNSAATDNQNTYCKMLNHVMNTMILYQVVAIQKILAPRRV